MTAQEIVNLLSDSISDGKLDRDSQVTVVDYDCGDAKLKRIDRQLPRPTVKRLRGRSL